jgi:putative flippase GtrA
MIWILKHPFVRKHVSQGFRFAVCGVIGMSIDLGTAAFLVEVFEWDPRLAYIPSTALAVVFVFLANKHFTFRNEARHYGSQFVKFAIVYGSAIAFNLGISYSLLWLGIHYLFSKIAAIGIVAVWNYTLSHSFVFRKREDVDVAIV